MEKPLIQKSSRRAHPKICHKKKRKRNNENCNFGGLLGKFA